MKKVLLSLLIVLSVVFLSFSGFAETVDENETEPILGPGGTNPNAESDTPILGPGGTNPEYDPDTPILGPGGIYRGPGIDDPAIHVYMYVNTSGGILHVREWPDSNASIIGELDFGEQVLVTGYAENHSWAKILFGSETAYVMSRYLSETPPERPDPQPTPYYPPYVPDPEPYVPYYETTITELNNQFTSMVLANTQYIVVTAHPSASSGAVMLYWAPDIASAVQRYCYDGESFTVLAYNNEWLQVRDEKSGFTGYMLREFAY